VSPKAVAQISKAKTTFSRIPALYIRGISFLPSGCLAVRQIFFRGEKRLFPATLKFQLTTLLGDSKNDLFPQRLTRRMDQHTTVTLPETYC